MALRAVGGALLAGALLAACGGAGEREVRVFAAASLRPAFDELAAAFGRAHPGVRVVGDFAGSQVLRRQLEAGAAADLFVSANPTHTRELQQAGALVGPAAVVAANEIVLAVPAGNPGRIGSLDDLAQAGRRLVMASGTAPAGMYARAMLTRREASGGGPGFAAAALRNVVSFETNVRLVAAKLELGEADAGFVYRSDVHAARGRLAVVAAPPEVRVSGDYLAAVARAARSPQLAEQFIAFLQSPAAQAILARRGFGGSGQG